MKTLSLKLDDITFQETEVIIAKLNKPRNRYINEAVKFYNKFQKNKELALKLHYESELVADNSMKILKEFETIEYVN
jgi:hypothetical protein